MNLTEYGIVKHNIMHFSSERITGAYSDKPLLVEVFHTGRGDTVPSKFSCKLNKKVLRREESAVLSGNPFSVLIRFG